MTDVTGDFFNTSYVNGTDDVSGWGHRYFFSFYSEFSEDASLVALEVTTLSVIFLVSAFGNVVAAGAILKFKEMRTITNLFLLNLTVADLLLAAGIPALIYTRLVSQWKLGEFLCKYLPYTQFVCCFVLLWTLTLISRDRYHCIVKPPYRSRLTPTKATVLTIITWVVSFLLFLPILLLFRTQTVGSDPNKISVCTIGFPKKESVNLAFIFTAVVLIFTCFIPLTLFVTRYKAILNKLNKRRKHWCNRSSDICSERKNAKIKSHAKVVRLLCANVVAVLVMWTPISVMMALIYVDGTRPNEDTNFFLRSRHFIWALEFALLNTVLNPILYGAMSKNFRQCLVRKMTKRRRVRNDKSKSLKSSNGCKSVRPSEHPFTILSTSCK